MVVYLIYCIMVFSFFSYFPTCSSRKSMYQDFFGVFWYFLVQKFSNFFSLFDLRQPQVAFLEKNNNTL